MPIRLRDTDIAVLNSLLKDGRKSLRQIAKDAGISTPTVKNRFNRLVNLGVIKSISPVLDLSKVTYTNKKKNKGQDLADIISGYNHDNQRLQNNKSKKKNENKGPFFQTDIGTAVSHDCDYCKTPLGDKMYMFKVASFERFFCCNECKMAYKKKYGGRMKAISKRSIQIN